MSKEPHEIIEYIMNMKVNDSIGFTLFDDYDNAVPAHAIMYTEDRILIEVNEKAPGFQMFKKAKNIKANLKNFEGRIYHGFEGEKKTYNGLGRQSWNWSVRVTPRNMTQLLYALGDDPYQHWDQETIPVEELNPRILEKNGWAFDAYDHQLEMACFAATYRHCIYACEPGTGKTLAMIMTLEHLNKQYNFKEGDIWYIGPKSATKSLPLELEKWRSGLSIDVHTYNSMVTQALEWEPNKPPPRAIIFDECQRLKTPDSLRSQAAQHFANAIRAEYGFESLILGMSGTPAPNTPGDWWSQCEAIAPGFIREGSLKQFAYNLKLVEQRENLQQGGTFPYVITWWDDENKCSICGQYENDPRHVSKSKNVEDLNKPHIYVKSENKIEQLFERLTGLVMVKLKKDCLDLPDMQYITKRVKPTVEQFRLYKMARDHEEIPIKAMSDFRKISDGFDYVYIDNPEKLIECPTCKGKGEYNQPKRIGGEDAKVETHIYEDNIKQCVKCKGEKKIQAKMREAQPIDTSKDEALLDLLDTYFDIGRLVVWAGFQATIDKLTELCRLNKWFVLKADGRGWMGISPLGDRVDSDELLKAMDQSHPQFEEFKKKYPQLLVMGHPEAAGTAVTFTAAPAAIYYSNTFKGEDRIQSEQRIHRAGMDTNRACVIYDLACLPSDLMIAENLRNKRNLERMTMGVMLRELEEESFNNEETI